MSKASDAFPLDLPWVRPYFRLIRSAAKQTGVRAAIIAGLISRESGGGRLLSPRGPAGIGDGGDGKGLMQISAKFHEFARTGPWRDPGANINYGSALLSGYIAKAGDLKTGIAMYNTGTSALDSFRAGRDPDETTAGHDYARDVLERAEMFRPVISSRGNVVIPLLYIGVALALRGK